MPDTPESPLPAGGGSADTPESPLAAGGGSADTPESPLAAGGGSADTPESPLAAGGGSADTPDSPLSTGLASATIDPAGSNNAFVATAKAAGMAGKIAVGIAAAAAGAATALAVTTDGPKKTITITPGTKARMQVSGTLTDGATPTPNVVTFPLMQFAGNVAPGMGTWTSDGASTPAGSGAWYRVQMSSNAGVSATDFTAEKFVDGSKVAEWNGYSTGGSAWPDDDAIEWAPLPEGLPSTGTPAVAAAASSSAQGQAAILASTPAAALITTANAAGNDGTGALAALAAVALGVDAPEEPV